MKKYLTAAIAVIALTASVDAAFADRNHPSADLNDGQNSIYTQTAQPVAPIVPTAKLNSAEQFIIDHNTDSNGY